MMTQDNALDRYTILRELGRGAIGTVYAARDRSTGAAVALKVLDPALFREPSAELAALFLKNARAAARLRHRNIVMIFGAEEGGGTAFVTMELVEGESLRRLLDERPVSIARAIRIFDDVASALAYAHEEKVVHRGVKPSNIIVQRSGVAKIGDFGLGQIGEAALRHMSPEQVRRDPVDHRSDLFSLGAVFYEMLTRRAPFDGASPQETREHILRTEPPPPSEVNPHVPVALDSIVSRLLAKNPDERFASARDLLRELQRLEEELGLGPGAGAAAVEPAPIALPVESEPILRIPEPANEDFHERDARFVAEPRPELAAVPRTSFLATLALILAVLSIGTTAVLYYSPDFVERFIAANRAQEAPRIMAAAPQPAAPPPPVASETKPEEPPVAAPAPSALPPAQPETLAAREPEQPATGDSAPMQETPQAARPTATVPRAAKPTATVPEPQPAGTAKLILSVAPRGELYIDGKHHGTTPPLTTLEIEPGMHRIEIRSGSRKPYLTYMTVEAGDERRIRHDFSAKPSRPPG